VLRDKSQEVIPHGLSLKVSSIGLFSFLGLTPSVILD